MSVLKVAVVLGFVLVFTHYSSSMDFSAMNFARSILMQYSGGTRRTVQFLEPKIILIPVTPTPTKRTRKVFGHGAAMGYGGRISEPKKTFKKKLTVVRGETKTYNTRSTPSNKFLEALTTVERGVADAKAAESWLRYSPQKLQSLKNTIKLAAGKRMYQYSRHRLGEALFLLRNSGAASSRPKRSTRNQTSSLSFVDDLKQSMGPAKFDEFMAVMGDVTLMFAIDTTGSMREEIATAKRIAVDVINYPRQNPVSYILSPFNDPSTGPVTFKDNTQGAFFVDAINKLSATGGGDCPELTLNGILDALYEHPDWDSPLYVFTDASAKDATPSNMEEVKSRRTQVLTNPWGTHNACFISGQTCGNVYKPFQELAEATSGQVLSLSNHHELKRLTGFTGSVLGGSNIISSGSNMSKRKKRRAVGEQRYSIKIDDSIEKMSVCITTERPNKGTTISLTDPRGVIITSGKISLSKVSVYEITRPKVGTWTLVCPPSIGQYNYFVKSHSDSNIEFEYYFLFTMHRPATEVPISQPLIGGDDDDDGRGNDDDDGHGDDVDGAGGDDARVGRDDDVVAGGDDDDGRQTKLVLTMAGFHKVQKNTVVLELITKYGEHIRDVSLTPDNQGMRYVATFTPPSRPFKLKIKGTTKAGNAFERISRNIIEPKHVLLRVFRSNKDFTLRRGQTSTVTFHLFNAAAANKVVNIQVKDRLGYVAALRRSTRTVRAGRWAFFGVSFATPSSAAVGVGDTVVASISVNNGAERSALPVQLIVVA
ncbi:hypothetical protein QZH41_017239 [Actinostola sp. cb2023]|nr:hypothetical protein QZH41_017239 [Actinostola sp. cb2023]